MTTEAQTPILSYDREQPLRRPQWWTIGVLCSLGITLLAFFIGGLGHLLAADVWRQYAASDSYNPLEQFASEVMIRVQSFAFPWCQLLTGLLLATWMYRTLRRLRALGTAGLRFSPIMAVLWWCVPLLNLIRPYEVMKEIYVASRGESIRKFTPLVGCWWGFWLAAEFVSIAGYITMSNQHEKGPNLYIAYGIWNGIVALLYLIPGILLAAVVYRVDRGMAKKERASAMKMGS